jgi:phosphoribosylaminoimidazolecarboxamide formyltransferase/IMP cyclohydrolase
MNLRKVKRAVISVSDKTGVAEFARKLAGFGVEILSTGGTSRLLQKEGVPVKDVSDYTGFPEMMDGRVKTLHPKIHGGILGMRDNPEHVEAMKKHGIEPIDMIVVNLYPFRETIAKQDCALEDAIENIDIGGPTMIRSAAKNYRDVAVVVDPADYERIAAELDKNDGATTEELRFELAVKVFKETSAYDGTIVSYLDGLSEKKFSKSMVNCYSKLSDLRYGENPHQSAAVYCDMSCTRPSLAGAEQLSGKELSYNNYLDLQSALMIILDFDEPMAAVLKHTNPCGAAVGADLKDAFVKAYAGDPVSAFGSVVGLTRTVDAAVAEEMASGEKFIEAVIAPDYEEEAVKILTSKPKWGGSVRLIRVGDLKKVEKHAPDVKTISGGALVQDANLARFDEDSLKVVTKKKPSDDEMKNLRFAWVICKHVKSNAIVLVKDSALVGVGAGQMSRLDSTITAVRKSGGRAKGSVLASDAFFPFPDALEEGIKAGITAAIEPGGAKNDELVIKAAEAGGISLAFTGMRHFKH